MNELQFFVHEDFGQVRVIEQNGEPWFVAADVCRALDIADTWNALQRLDGDEKGTCSISTLGGEQKVSIVNEPGLYSLVLGSRKPEAKAFKRWITHEVLPAIRKTGSYSLVPAQPQRTITTDDYLRAASIVANCRNERLPYVLGFLEQGGLSVPKIQEMNAGRLALADGRHTRYAKTTEDVNAQMAACAIINEAIERYGFSQVQISRITGIQEGCIFRYRKGKRPTPERARYIVDVLTRYLPQEGKMNKEVAEAANESKGDGSN